MKKILCFFDYFYPHLGWAENVFDNITSRLARDWYEITVITSRHETKVSKTEKSQNITIFRVGTNRKNMIWPSIKLAYKLCKKEKFDAIYTSTRMSSISAKIVSIIFHIPAIIIVHEVFGKIWFDYKWLRKGLLWFFLEKIIIWLHFDIYHTVSHYTYNSLRLMFGISDNKLAMIYNGVEHDFRDYKNIDTTKSKQMLKMYNLQDKFVVMYLGHTGYSKGIDYLIDAIPSVVQANPDIVFVMNLLKSDRYDHIKHKIKDLNLSSNIIEFDWTIAKKELLHRISMSDCVIVPSITDGFGLVAGEIWSLGKPLVVSWTSALPEVCAGLVRFITPRSSSSIVEWIQDIQTLLTNLYTKHNIKKNSDQILSLGSELLDNKKYQNIRFLAKKKFNREDSLTKIKDIINQLGI